jgi:uncharacterized protein
MLDKYWQPIHNLPADGRDFRFTDQEFWFAAFKRYKLEFHPAGPITAKYHVAPSGDGFLIRGHIRGGIVMPCDRCVEDTRAEIDEDFELYEEPAKPDEEEPPERPLVREREGLVELDEAGMLWEQLMLALPVKPLCGVDCRGICPECGRNLNITRCGCEEETGDPRMAVFRDLKIS